MLKSNQIILILMSLMSSFSSYSQEAEKRIPLTDGEHDFVLRYGEHPNIIGPEMTVTIKHGNISVSLKKPYKDWPMLFDEGKLLWHNASEQWIIGHSDDDAFAKDVGGCSDGPLVIDLESKYFWTC